MTYGGDWISGKYKAFWETDKTLIGMAAKHMTAIDMIVKLYDPH